MPASHWGDGYSEAARTLRPTQKRPREIISEGTYLKVLEDKQEGRIDRKQRNRRKFGGFYIIGK